MFQNESEEIFEILNKISFEILNKISKFQSESEEARKIYF